MNRVSNFCLLGLSLVFSFVSAPIFAESSDKNIVSRTAEIDGLQLHYMAAGHGPTVILLHGYAETSRMVCNPTGRVSQARVFPFQNDGNVSCEALLRAVDAIDVDDPYLDRDLSRPRVSIRSLD